LRRCYYRGSEYLRSASDWLPNASLLLAIVSEKLTVRGYPVMHSVEVPGSDERIVVTEYWDFRGPWPNLFRLRPDGTEIWAATPPGGPDAHVSVEVIEGEVIARSHYGLCVRIDLDTGDPVSVEHE
jgi:hypothetical protein